MPRSNRDTRFDSTNSPRRFGGIQPWKPSTRAHSPISTYASSPMYMHQTTRNQYGSGWSEWSGGGSAPAPTTWLAKEAAKYAALSHEQKFMFPKRRFWKTEQQVARVFSRYFSRV